MVTIGVIGAGPKAISIVAKARALSELGYVVPKLVVFERAEVCAHWTGHYGLTDGLQPLGTPPEKDVGYPYPVDSWGKDSGKINEKMARLSWYAYQIEEGRYADWIDRGQPPPVHSEFAAYLKWVARQIEFNNVLRIGEVKRLSIVED